jgi:hypothetical protein
MDRFLDERNSMGNSADSPKAGVITDFAEAISNTEETGFTT